MTTPHTPTTAQGPGGPIAAWTPLHSMHDPDGLGMRPLVALQGMFSQGQPSTAGDATVPTTTTGEQS